MKMALDGSVSESVRAVLRLLISLDIEYVPKPRKRPNLWARLSQLRAAGLKLVHMHSRTSGPFIGG